MRVLLVEDSERLQRSVGTGLRKAGYAVDVTGDGNEGLWYATGNDYDVIVLDLMLPGLDGLSLLRRLREAGKNTHVLILTARDTIEDRVLGLRTGSDDYLVKPFAFDELLAHVEALTRRADGVKKPVLCAAGLEIDFALRSARRNGRPLDLPPREFALLEYLALRRGQLCSRSDIEAHIYDQRRADEQRRGLRYLRAAKKDRPARRPIADPDPARAGYVFDAPEPAR